MNRHVLSILLENEPGALSRVVGLFSARGYNIESLTVAPTEDPTVSRMIISELLGVAYTQIRNPDSNLSLLGRS